MRHRRRKRTVKRQQIIIARLAGQLLGVGDCGIEGGHVGLFLLGTVRGLFRRLLLLEVFIYGYKGDGTGKEERDQLFVWEDGFREWGWRKSLLMKV